MNRNTRKLGIHLGFHPGPGITPTHTWACEPTSSAPPAAVQPPACLGLLASLAGPAVDHVFGAGLDP